MQMMQNSTWKTATAHKENKDISAIHKAKNLFLGLMDREFNLIFTFHGQVWPTGFISFCSLNNQRIRLWLGKKEVVS